MKNTHINKLFAALALAIIAITIAGCNNAADPDADPAGEQETQPPATDRIYSIRDIEDDPLAFTGEITINCVMANFAYTDPKMFGVKDTVDVFSCQTVDCGSYKLFMKYDGDVSELKSYDELNITGSFAPRDPIPKPELDEYDYPVEYDYFNEYDQDYIFIVTKIEFLRNIETLIE